MTTASEIAKICVYDSEGNVLLQESIERLRAQLGVTIAPEEKKGDRYAKLGKPAARKVAVKDLTTGKEWEAQSEMANEIRPGMLKADGAHNNFGCYLLYDEFPGRFAKRINGVWVTQWGKAGQPKSTVATPVVPTTTAETSAESK